MRFVRITLLVLFISGICGSIGHITDENYTSHTLAWFWLLFCIVGAIGNAAYLVFEVKSK